MAVERLLRAAARAADERAGPLALSLAVFTMGVVFGALAVGGLGEADKQVLAGTVADLWAGLGQGRSWPGPAAALAGALGRHLRTVALVWFLGLSVAGSPGVLGLVLLRGFAAGFAAGFLSAELGWRGMLFAAAALLPHGLLAIPALVLAAAGALHFGAQVAWGGARRDRVAFYRALGRYNGWMAAVLGVFLAAGAVEALITPLLMRLVVRV